MMFELFFPSYFVWHYGRAFADLLALYTTALRFTLRLFSLGTLLRTLFSPWRRMGEEYKKGFDPEAFFSSLIVNILMRLVGAFIRIIVIIFGLVTLAFVVMFGVIAFALWALAPFLVVVGILRGIALLV